MSYFEIIEDLISKLPQSQFLEIRFVPTSPKPWRAGMISENQQKWGEGKSLQDAADDFRNREYEDD